MRKRMAFRLQDEAKQLKGLFKDLVSLYCTVSGNVIKEHRELFFAFLLYF